MNHKWVTTLEIAGVLTIVGALTLGSFLGVRWLLGNEAAFALAGFLVGYAAQDIFR
jgi:hypothetical protein